MEKSDTHIPMSGGTELSRYSPAVNGVSSTEGAYWLGLILA